MFAILTEAEERDLLEQARAGKADALDRLLTLLEQSVFGFALSMCRDVEDAREVLQETFLSAIRSLRDFRGECRLRTWLYRIAVNSCGRLHRERWVHRAEELPAGESPPGVDGVGRGEGPARADDPEASMLRGELRERLERAIDRLPPPYKAVLLLRDVEGFATEEAAHILGVSEAVVKTRLHRARLFVRQELDGYVAGPR